MELIENNMNICLKYKIMHVQFVACHSLNKQKANIE